ncbi:recombinase family protein [uncultured Bacteroides sp.]|uniref:recombinase family protein n=1 Tax=uncultured Bacteroides sp. TaxID=162156 RepID=UPI002AA6BC3D|nr:recombinase family protein [uncultured Bacteroides sp.]
MKGAIYSRVSTEDQDYSKQTNELKDYAKANGIEVVYTFEEKISGFKNDREEFEKLRQLTKNDIDIILVWELSRLSRKSIYLQQQVREFADIGICIYSKKEGLHTLNEDGSDNQLGMFAIGITSMIAEQEVATFKARTISSKRNKILKQGSSYTYKAAYGYDYNTETKKLSINDEEAEVVKRIFQLSADGYSCYRIPVILNGEGGKTKGGKNWTVPTISSLLVNTVYKGEAKLRLKSDKPKEGKKYRKVTEAATVKVPAIVSAELYDLAISKMKERTIRSKSSGVKHFQLLRGLIKCPYCNVSYTYSSSKSVYCCHDRYAKATNKQTECKSKSIKSHKIEYIIWETVKVLYYKELANNKTQANLKPLKEEVEELEKKIAGLEKKQAELTDKANLIVNAAIEIKTQFPNLPDLYTNKLKEADSINKEAGKYLQEKEIILKQIKSKENQIEAIQSISDINSIVNTITDETEKYDLIHKVIDNIVIYNDERTSSIIIVTFKTGQVIYIGYYSSKKYNYYTIFYKSNDVFFDTEKKKGYIKGNIISGFSLSVETKEYSITDFLKQFDTPENRYYF